MAGLCKLKACRRSIAGNTRVATDYDQGRPSIENESLFHEVAPGIDVERDVLGQSEIPLRVSPNLRVTDAALFRPEPFGLRLKPESAHV